MNLPHEQENRDVIPIWRNFCITSELGELSHLNTTPPIKFDLSALKTDWDNFKSIGTAADLVNAHFISDQEISPKILEAVHYINNYSNTSDLLLKLTGDLCKKSTDSNTEDNNTDIVNRHTLVSQLKYIIENDVRSQIKNFKKLTIRDPKNAINWVELARLYSIEGNKYKAERNILNALFLAPDNRFVLRSASRLFIEIDDPEKSLYFLRKSKHTGIDPWLTSAHIAVSSYTQKFSPFIKNALKQRESKSFTHFDLTELNSSLGTLELSNGNFKKSKPFFNDSLKYPNDNSLAQFQFILNQDSRLSNIIQPLNSDVKNNYEALALKNKEEGNWDKAVENALKWFIDIPYSTEPAVLASYILCTVIADFEMAVEICELSLKTNPKETGILNNLTYSLLQLNRIDEAKKYLDIMNSHIKLKENSLTKEASLTFIATNALYLIKIGNIDDGILMYQEAIMIAKKEGLKYYLLAGQLNLAKELEKINHYDSKQLIDKVLKFNLEDHKDLQAFRQFNFNQVCSN